MVYARTTETTNVCKRKRTELSQNCAQRYKTSSSPSHLQTLIKQYKVRLVLSKCRQGSNDPERANAARPGFTAAAEFCCYLTFLAGCFFALRAKTCYCPAKCWKCISRRSCFHDDVLIKPCYSRANGDLTVGHYKTHFSTTTYL